MLSATNPRLIAEPYGRQNDIVWNYQRPERWTSHPTYPNLLCLAFTTQAIRNLTPSWDGVAVITRGPCSCSTLLWHAIKNTADSLFLRPGLQQSKA